ncbi:hypothetical protein Btru_061303 [Bulinus truncatus]|nr:hypothetical protein Btru_061303 [Bulinus truncatus]
MLMNAAVKFPPALTLTAYVLTPLGPIPVTAALVSSGEMPPLRRVSFYGSNCMLRCNCNPEGSTCDKFTGACQCYTGWEGPKCDTDINECLKVGNLCGTLGICVNTNGGYQCVCHPGYKLNSSNLCEECDSNHYGANCISQCLCQPQNSVCNKVTGACKCTIGWEGPTCYSDINECLKDRNVCGSKVSSDACVNTNGGYYCDCPVGYRLSDLNTCEAVLSLTIVIRFPFYTPPDSHLIISSTSYRVVIRELENAINKQLRRLVKGFLIFVVQGLRRGSLIVDSNLTMFEDVNNNTAGLLTKGLTSLNWTDVTIDGAHQNATIIMSNGYSISTDADQCSLRNIIQPCPPDTFCSIDKDGVSYCQRRPTLESNDVISEKGLYIGLGIGVGVFVLVAAAVIITACVMKRRRKETT